MENHIFEPNKDFVFSNISLGIRKSCGFWRVSISYRRSRVQSRCPPDLHHDPMEDFVRMQYCYFLGTYSLNYPNQ